MIIKLLAITVITSRLQQQLEHMSYKIDSFLFVVEKCGKDNSRRRVLFFR